METINYVLTGVITLLAIGTIFNFIPDTEDTHVCIIDEVVEMSMKCSSLSSTGRTCYPNPDNRRGSKLCDTAWVRIDRTDLKETYETSKGDWICDNQGECIKIKGE